MQCLFGIVVIVGDCLQVRLVMIDAVVSLFGAVGDLVLAIRLIGSQN